MKKIVLSFPSKAEMAEFILACKIIPETTDIDNCRITGVFDEECLSVALERFGAVIDSAPDFIGQE